MATNLTVEAAAGWDWQRAPNGSTRTGDNGTRAADACPYLYSSPASMAWHLGRHLAKGGFPRPSVLAGEAKVFQGRGDRLRLDVSEKKSDRATFFRWNSDNTFSEEA